MVERVVWCSPFPFLFSLPFLPVPPHSILLRLQRLPLPPPMASARTPWRHRVKPALNPSMERKKKKRTTRLTAAAERESLMSDESGRSTTRTRHLLLHSVPHHSLLSHHPAHQSQETWEALVWATSCVVPKKGWRQRPHRPAAVGGCAAPLHFVVVPPAGSSYS